MSQLAEELRSFMTWFQGEISAGNLNDIPRRDLIKLRTIADDLRIDAERFGATVDPGSGRVAISDDLAKGIVTPGQEHVPMSNPLNEYATIRPSPRVKAMLGEYPPGQDPISNLALFMDKRYEGNPKLSDSVVNFATALIRRVDFLNEHYPKKRPDIPFS